MAQSIEPAVVRHYTDELTSLRIKFYEQQISMNNSIDSALKNAESKRGGTGDNRPDIKLLLEDTHTRRIPVMIEAKGTKGKLEKLNKKGEIELVTIYEKDGKEREDGTFTYKAGDKNYKAIEGYAVNGAIHYANAVLDGKDYDEVIAIGINGFGEENGKAKNLECKAYYISERNNRVPKLIDNITENDWSLLKEDNIDKLYNILDTLSLTADELEKLVSAAESDLDAKIHKIHQKIYDDKAITLNTSDKMFLFCGLIMAGLSAEGLEELKVESLRSSSVAAQSDGVKLMTQIEAFLDCKRCPVDKKQMILHILANVFSHNDLWKPRNGESIFKSLYKEVKTNIIPCLESPLHLDFMGRIFNRLGDWIPIANDQKNDVVLTPRYVEKLMAKLCRVNKDSFVWDRTMGSAGFLVTAMDLMIKDAQNTINDAKELEETIEHIKKHQLFGIEVLPEVFILAVINMILMGDGSSNMIRGNAHDKTIGQDFPANVFLLNPPYSAEAKGFVFVEEALSMMQSGYAAVLIQENAGSGQGLPYTKRVLEKNTLLASIHMSKIFLGKAGVQTAIYVFKIGEKHDPNHLVKFIDFSNDGYARQSKKKATQDVNLRNVDDAIGRYTEVERIVLGQHSETSYYTKENGLYIEDTITLEGNDWTYAQHQKIDTTPTAEDFNQVIKNFISYRIDQVIQKIGIEETTDEEPLFKEFLVSQLFDIHPTKAAKLTVEPGKTPVLSNTSSDNGITKYLNQLPTENGGVITFSDTTESAKTVFYQPDPFIGFSHVQGMYPWNPEHWTENACLYFISAFKKAIGSNFDYATKFNRDIANNIKVQLPVTANGNIDFIYMENHIKQLKEAVVEDVNKYLKELL